MNMNRKKSIMIFIGFLFLYAFLVSCAGLDVKRDAPMKSSLQGNRIVVFPFMIHSTRGVDPGRRRAFCLGIRE